MESHTEPKKTFAGRIVSFAKNDIVQMTALMAATAVVSAGLAREITLRQAFTFDQMDYILKDEDLQKALIDAALAK
jgi:hypothetical protein